jgi:hypothetical protein
MNVPSTIISPTSAVDSAEARVARYDWKTLSDELGGFGCAVMEKLLSPEECRLIAGLYPEEGHFRSHIHMARHGFGKGEYRYFGILDIRCPICSVACARRFIRASPASPTTGTAVWASTSATRPNTPPS